jgi:outer membrane lipoprotein-sorting protein
MKNYCVVILALAVRLLFSQQISGDALLVKVDENIGSDNKITVGEMVIKGRRGTRRIKSKSWIQGMEKSFTEYLAPAREQGTKMLKLEDQLWTYSPATDRTIKISGHMLRQSVMGSDLSYEDLMEDTRLTDLYTAQVTGEEVIRERPCWVLTLTAKVSDVAYYARRVWIDKERYVILREYRYAKSGKLLKTTEVLSVKNVENRWVANAVLFKDALKSGEGTEFLLESIEFNARIPGYIFTKAALRK